MLFFQITCPICAVLFVGAYPYGSSREIEVVTRPSKRGSGFAPDPVARRWEASRTHVVNPSYVLVFYRYKLDRIPFDQFIWQPYPARILHDNPKLGQESKL